MTLNISHTSRGCLTCGSNKDIKLDGFIVCVNCGTTNGRQYVDHAPSFGSNGSTTLQNSIGKNIDFVGALGSQIGYSSGHLTGKRGVKLNSKVSSKYYRLIRLHHNRSRIEGSATHLRTMIAFTRVFNTLGISRDIKNQALHLYWKKVKSGYNITNHVLLIALCLLHIVREVGDRAPIRFSEIISAFANNGHRVTNKNILRLARDLNIPLSAKSRQPEDYINRIASLIKHDKKVIERLSIRRISPDEYEMLLIYLAMKFLKQLSRRQRGGVQPYPFAVSIIYLADRAFSKASRRKPVLTQQILAEAATSAEFTIRDHVYRFLGDLYSQNESYLVELALRHLGSK